MTYSEDLKRIVKTNNLEGFFTEADLDGIASAADLKLAEWLEKFGDVPPQTRDKYARSMLALALYRIDVLLDTSASMLHEGHRIETVERTVSNIIELNSVITNDGIHIHYLNGTDPTEPIKSADEFAMAWHSIQFHGTTRLGTVLTRLWSEIIQDKTRFAKPCLIYIITDGRPEAEPKNALARSIIRCKDVLNENGYVSTAINFGIVQVGNDGYGREFLRDLKRDTSSSDHFDIVIEDERLERNLEESEDSSVSILGLLTRAIINDELIQEIEKTSENKALPLAFPEAIKGDWNITRPIQINGNRRPTVLVDRNLFVASFAVPAPSAAKSNYILIQTTGPLTAQQQQLLRDKQVVILEYKGHDVYLCGYKPESLDGIKGLTDFVSAVEVYHPGYVVEYALKSGRADEEVLVDIVLHSNVEEGDFSRVQKDIAACAKISVLDIELERSKARVKVLKGKLISLAKIDEVKTINKVHEPRLFSNVSSRIIQAHVPIQTQNGGEAVYRGRGQVVCVADTGFDTGDLNNYHPAFGSRVIALQSFGRPESRETGDPVGHGTHVSGCVAANGHYGEEHVQSPASEAQLIVQSLFSCWDKYDDDPKTWVDQLGGIPKHYIDLFNPAWERGARVHTNSWGRGPSPWQESSSGDIDKYLWDNKKMVVLFAAGNEGVDLQRPGHVDLYSLTAEASAKNCITVGASESDRPNRARTYGSRWPVEFPNPPIHQDDIADNPEGMAAFSSRGFALPGHRIKPDVVAPGTSILSTRSTQAVVFDEDDGHVDDIEWSYMSGTSMATPIVAGCCAVIRGALVDNDSPDPSAALIKAILINGAVPLKGQYKYVNPSDEQPETQDFGPFPPRHYQDFGIEYYQEFGVFANTSNPSFGFGRVNLDNSLQHVHKYNDESTCLRDQDDIKVGFFDLEDGRDFHDLPGRRAGFFELAGDKALGEDGIHRSKFQFFVYTPTDKTPNLTLKVTLAWNDPPGEGLQNDLDLVVRIRRGDDGVEERHGNMHAGDPRFDRVNNVEQVVWRDVGGQKVYEVEIKAYKMKENPQPCAVAWHLYQDNDLGKYMESVRREALARLERGKTIVTNLASRVA